MNIKKVYKYLTIKCLQTNIFVKLWNYLGIFLVIIV